MPREKWSPAIRFLVFTQHILSFPSMFWHSRHLAISYFLSIWGFELAQLAVSSAAFLGAYFPFRGPHSLAFGLSWRGMLPGVLDCIQEGGPADYAC